MSKAHGGSDRGFTLVEVMVSLLIFTVISMGLLPLLITALQVNQGNRLHDQARRLAGEAMAQLQVVSYANLVTVSDEPLLAGDVELRQLVEQNLPVFDQSRVTVTARWQTQGRSHRYQLQTIRSAP